MPAWVMPVSILCFVVLLVLALVFRRSSARHPEFVDDDDDEADADDTTGKTRLEECALGDVVRFHGSLVPGAPLRLCIDRIDGYESEGERWREWTGRAGGRRYSFEVEDGRALLCLSEHLPPQAVELPADCAPALVAEQYPQVHFRGQDFHLAEVGDARYFEHEDGLGEALSYAVYRSSDGDQLLTIESWNEAHSLLAHSVVVDDWRIENE